MTNQFPTTGTMEGDIKAGYITNGVYNPNPTVVPPVNPSNLQNTMNQGSSGGNTGQQGSSQTVIPPQISQQSNPLALFQAMNAMNSQFRSNNAMMSQRNLLLKQLYDTPLTTEELNQLDPTMKDAVLKNDKDQIDMQLRIISDEVQGRNQSIDKSIQYLMTTYQQAIKDAETQRIQSQNTVLDYAKSLNAKPSDVAKALNVRGNFDWTALDALAAPVGTETPKDTEKGKLKAAISSMSQELSAVKGSDGYIDPKDYLTAKRAWVNAGYASKDFDTTFSVYRNPNDTYNLD